MDQTLICQKFERLFRAWFLSILFAAQIGFSGQMGLILAAQEIASQPVKAISNKTQFESKLAALSVDDQGCRTANLKLDECETDATLEIVWKIENDTDEQWLLPSITSSCGCVQTLQSHLELIPNECAEVTVRVHLPKEEGVLKKQLAFFDAGGICRLLLELEFCFFAPFVVPDVIPIDMEGQQRLQIPISLRSKNYQASDFTISADGVGISGGRLVFSSPQENPTIELVLDTDSMGQEPRHRFDLEFVDKQTGVTRAKLVRQLWIRNRPYSKPSLIRLVSTSDGWVGDFTLIVDSRDRLPSTLEADHVRLDMETKDLRELNTKLQVLSAVTSDACHEMQFRLFIEDRSGKLVRNDLFGLVFSCAHRVVRVKCIAIP